MKYTDSYDMRNSGEDMADKAMQQYLRAGGHEEYKDWLKVGTDPKENKLSMFWFATKILLLPDYIMVKNNFIYFIEVKGTNRLKEDDYYKIQEMAYKGSRYKEVKVGLMYFANKYADPKWFNHLDLRDIWMNDDIPMKYYPELDFRGNKKPYKEIPV